MPNPPLITVLLSANGDQEKPNRGDQSMVIAIIDKNADMWGRLETPDWEKWFTRKELERLLKRDCRTVSSQFISYWEDVAPDGLFLAWLAVR